MDIGSFARAAAVGGALAAALGNRAPLSAQQSGTIAGTVIAAETRGPIAGARVSLEIGGFDTRSDTAGRFRLAQVPTGPQAVRVALAGYAPARTIVQVSGGAIAEVELSLKLASTELPEVTVIGTKTDLAETREQLQRVPGSVDLIEPTEIRSTRQANLKDVLRFTPGVYVQPRFGAADESQISIRGSGLRNNFHARGVNLLVNGMPYRNADGFTDFESLELLTTEALQVYKGGNALRYGGSTLGGAINLDTKTGYTANRYNVFAEAGSFGFFKGQLSSGGSTGPFDYYGSYARTSLSGFRDWSDQSRDRFNAHLGYRVSPATDARAFYFYAHVDERLPGALTQSELYSNPRAANADNVSNRWGRDYDLHHLGLQLRTQLTPTQRLQVSPYVQYRDIDHPIFQVIAQISRDYGVEVRYENTGRLVGRTNRLTLGFQPAYQNMDNRQYVNLAGRHGDLRKNQKDEVTGLAFYGEDALAVTPRLSAVVGLRYDRSVRASDDFFLSDGDQSDRRVFEALTPKVGFLYELANGGTQLYGNVSRSYEPPLLLELNSLTVPGFIDLNGQDAWQVELGTRGRSGLLTWDVSVFDVELQNEILNLNVQPFPGATFTVPTYRNAARTRHYGLEAGLGYSVPTSLFAQSGGGDAIAFRLAYTYARYRFVSDSVFDGNEIPGAPGHFIATEIKYLHPAGFSIAPSLEWAPESYFVNSENTSSNLGWANLNVRGEWALPRAGITLFAAAHNLTGRTNSPSVQVDNAAGRSFEPADSRSFYAGVQWSRR